MSTPRTILITGCSTGIGLASARTLKSRGWRVIATARKPEDIARLKADEGLETLHCEMADTQSVAQCVEEALALTSGRLDALYNNAAYGIIGAMEDVTPDKLRHQFEVNVISAHALTRGVVPAMRAQGHGRIVMCSSVLGFIAGPYRGAYCASKYALEAMSDAFRLELKPSGIHVSLIEPGPIESEFLATTITSFKNGIDMANSAHAAYYERRLAEMQVGGKSSIKLGPDAVVARLVHALESPRPKARYRVGLATHAAAILKRALPDVLLDRVLMRM
ncbi:MAG: SDR family NAD(P)-dependent oxidoreductase [Hyphomicrobiaceae bacterium]